MKIEFEIAAAVLLMFLLSRCGGTAARLEDRSKQPNKLDCELSASFNLTPSPGTYHFTIEQDGLNREYKVYVPKSYSVGKCGLPVFIYVHGGGGTVDTAFADRIDSYADKYGFILAAPGGYQKSWNGGAWGGGSCCGTQDDVGFISKMIDELGQKYPIDKRRVFAAGISNGGLMTNRLACDLSSKIAAIATVAPAAVEQPCTPSRPVPTMDIHGTGDTCNPFNGGTPTANFCANVPYTRMTPQQVVDSWLATNGCTKANMVIYQNGAATCTSYSPCNGNAEVRFCRVEGMGHTWPSGAQYLPISTIGPVSHDISTDQIWDFFSRHPRNP